LIQSLNCRAVLRSKKDIETRASKLETEVKWLREELKSIRDLLGLKLQNSNSGKS
jgi:hypothetical protein